MSPDAIFAIVSVVKAQIANLLKSVTFDKQIREYFMYCHGNLIVVQGPTASGKTALSIQLAKEFGSSVLSADSRQFYREMTIGTAVPSSEELSMAKHYFIQDRSVLNPLNAGSYAEEALLCLEKLFKNNNTQIVVGGSGLYVNALVYGMDDLPSDEIIRAKLNDAPFDELLQELEERDPDYYNVVDRCNRQRIVRAVEICRITGSSYTALRNGGKRCHSMNVIQIAVDLPRADVYDRINKRVDLMMQMGLLEEARHLYQYRNLSPLNTVGYKELFAFLDGKYTLDEAVNQIKINTRHYAKRQLTWLRANHEITWFNPNDFISIKEFVLNKLNT